MSIFQFLGFILLFSGLFQCNAYVHHKFEVKRVPYTRLCSTKNILTVNGEYPGPILYAHKGETLYVDVYNKGDENITIHWHGVKQPRNPWTDGPEYITQCPIKPGGKFSQKIILSTEVGTLWWHAHSDWSRATVHGLIVIYPMNGTGYPFPKPDAEVPIILGEWWKSDVEAIRKEMLQTGGGPNVSDALTINGQPGDFYPCSKPDTFKVLVDYGKTYLLRMVNAGLTDLMYFAVANHELTIVGTDGSYLKPFKSNYITISPGQTIEAVLHANKTRDHYYLAARVFSSSNGLPFINTTTTGIIEYRGNYTPSSPPPLPSLPSYNDTNASATFTGSFRGLQKNYRAFTIPKAMSTKLIFTLSVNTFPCTSGNSSTCQGPNGTRIATSVNNISFVQPSIDILQAYYKNISGVYGADFPSHPPLVFDYTSDYVPLELETPRRGTEVRVLEYNSTVELVFQGTNVANGATEHPMHLHGTSFYVVGWGFGNFNKSKDPLHYNLVDPPLQQTIAVPKNGWTAIRFKAYNPGVWFLHCHLERHLTWGMDMAFIIKNGVGHGAQMLPPPPDMPPC